jgi:hypothetical protein
MGRTLAAGYTLAVEGSAIDEKSVQPAIFVVVEERTAAARRHQNVLQLLGPEVVTEPEAGRPRDVGEVRGLCLGGWRRRRTRDPHPQENEQGPPEPPSASRGLRGRSR